jgi:ATP/maltotriose-dependent transcriptional regulator MalT
MNHLSTEAKQQIGWRRAKVLELSSQGYSERKISEILKVNDTAVQRFGISKTASAGESSKAYS